MMDMLHNALDLLIHFDTHLDALIQHGRLWSYAILFLIIFAETGLVVTPFLPGDSLLFVLGAFAAKGTFHPLVLLGLLMSAAILGDSVNYAVGKYLGNRLLKAKHIPFFKKEHVDRTHRFYKKYGGKTIILARFMPIIRTFAPFVAGIANMDYAKFLIYNVSGGILWVSLFVLGGYFFGNIPIVKEHFEVVVLLIIIVSILPGVVEFLKAKARSAKEKKQIAA
jgi:membrane-associated protein